MRAPDHCVTPPLRRLAEASPLTAARAPAGFRTLAEAVANYPYRSAIAPGWTGARTAEELAPILGAIALIPGVPFGGADLAEAVDAAIATHAAGGTYLVLAADEAQRDDAKRRIVAAIEATQAVKGGAA